MRVASVPTTHVAAALSLRVLVHSFFHSSPSSSSSSLNGRSRTHFHDLLLRLCFLGFFLPLLRNDHRARQQARDVEHTVIQLLFNLFSRPS